MLKGDINLAFLKYERLEFLDLGIKDHKNFVEKKLITTHHLFFVSAHRAGRYLF